MSHINRYWYISVGIDAGFFSEFNDLIFMILLLFGA